jgi:hypothetical protein
VRVLKIDQLLGQQVAKASDRLVYPREQINWSNFFRKLASNRHADTAEIAHRYSQISGAYRARQGAIHFQT